MNCAADGSSCTHHAEANAAVGALNATISITGGSAGQQIPIPYPCQPGYGFGEAALFGGLFFIPGLDEADLVTAAEDGSGFLSRLGARLTDETGAIGRYGNLGNLADRADETLADVIRSRGGGASQIRQLQTGYGELTLGEISELAASGDREAIRAIKMAKQAGSQGKGGH